MRFLIFNVVVGAALIYLFTADRADIHGAANLAYDTVRDIQVKAQDTISNVWRDEPEVSGAKTKDAGPPAQHISTGHTALPPLQSSPLSLLSPETPETVAGAPVKTAVPVLPVAQTKVIPNEPVIARTETPGHAPERLVPPEVAVRRAEVLAGHGSANAELVQAGESAISATDRRQDLHRLAEDMELFAAEAVGR